MRSSGERAQSVESENRVLTNRFSRRIYDGLECEITPRAHINLDQL